MALSYAKSSHLSKAIRNLIGVPFCFYVAYYIYFKLPLILESGESVRVPRIVWLIYEAFGETYFYPIMAVIAIFIGFLGIGLAVKHFNAHKAQKNQ
ncbi:hypothetical protein [Rodentibacter abscessus]|nr:hypothetical protein HEMROJRC1_15330 [Rodentibacter sp. JRC1]